ncbi:MAG: sulfatase [Candidatus Poribacteria bacterium]
MHNERLNIVTVISHDLGQHIGCYGVPNVRTPNFDAFAAQGVRFENNFCTAPQCSPSRAALWTGRYPHANGVVGLAHSEFQNDLHDDERHLAQILGDEGYDTHLFGNQHVSPNPKRCGFKGIHGGGPCGKIASAVSKFLAEWNGRDRPLFIQAAFSEPHRPFPHEDVKSLDPATLWVPPYLPDIPEVREDLAHLEASCSSADKAFGAIVEAIDRCGMADDTIVVFTVDHGIAFPHAKMTLYDPGVETALLMRIPDIEDGKVYKEMISNVDFAPTILELLNIKVPENIQGRSFKGLLTGEEYKPNEAVFAEKTYHTYYDPMRAIRTAKWKLIANFEFAPWQETSPDYHNNAKSYVEIAKARPTPSFYHPPFELYNLQDDPWEQENLADKPECEDIRDGLIRRLRQWMRDTADPLLDGPMAQGAYRKRMETFLKL